MKKYYKAYDDRYRQIHGQNLQWSSDEPSPVVAEIIRQFSITTENKLLEIGCGEGRDSFLLLMNGYNLLATDVSSEAIEFCKRKHPEFAEHFKVVDCIADTLDQKFDFIFSVAVLHMLVSDSDRNAFYRFIREHIVPGGVALICTMGDGVIERQTDTKNAFELQERVHQQSGQSVLIASTSCRIVNFDTFGTELSQNGFAVIQKGITSAEPDFPQMMFAVVTA